MTRWSLFPHFIVRTTGFPFELVERLRCSQSAALVHRTLAAQARLEVLRKNAPRIRRPPSAVLAALKANRPVPLEGVEDPSLFNDWNAAAGELVEAETAFERAFARELPGALEALKSITSDPRFLEAIASSSPPVYLDLVRGRWSTRVERQVASYVQRFSAKNETMSFFGPINYGRFDRSRADGVELVWSGPAKLKRRHTHAASWMVQGLVEAIAFDPAIAPWLVFRRKGYATSPLPKGRLNLGAILVEQGAVTQAQVDRVLELQKTRQGLFGSLLIESGLCTQAEVERALAFQAGMKPLESESAETVHLLSRLFGAVDGSRRLEQVARSLKVPVESLVKVAKLGCDKRLFTHQLEVPSSTYLPVNDLVERLAGIPGPAARGHLRGLDEVLERMARYSQADAATKVQLLDELRLLVEERWKVTSPFAPKPVEPGAPPAQERRRADPNGQFYADRLPMREECGGDLRLQINGARAQEIADRVQRPLDLLACASEKTRLAARAKVAQLIGKKRVPFWKVVAAFADHPIPYDSSLTDWVKAKGTDPAAQTLALDASTYSGVPPADGLPLICSVDLLICAKDLDGFQRGEFELVMGDIHDTAQVWGWALQFLEDRQQVETEMVKLMGRATRAIPVITALASRRTGLLPSEFPGPVVELGGVSVRPSSWKMPFDDLWVQSDGQTAHLWSDTLGTEVVLYNGELESLVHTAFAIPRIRAPKIDFGDHSPRVTVDGVVLQRETWKLPAAAAEELIACKDDKARLKCAVKWWRDLSLPTVVFAKFPGERKPVLVDPANPYVLRALATMLEDKGSASLSEMLPSTEQLWLKSELGRHTVELRCSFIRGAD